MPYEAQIRLLDTSYNLVAVFTPGDNIWLAFEWTRAIDTTGTHKLTLIQNADTMPLFTTDCFVELWLRDPVANLAWYCEYMGFHRSPERDIDDSQHKLFISNGVDLKHLLQRRAIRYFTQTIYADKIGPSDDVMKEYVIENAGIGATSPPRFSDGVIANFDVAAPLGLGASFNGSMGLRQLYESIREIALFSLVDFDVVFTGVTGAPLFEFRTYYPFLGTDRTSGASILTLSIEHDAMALPISYLFDRGSEINSMLVLGQGSGDDRLYTVADAATTTDSPWNLVEGTRDWRQQDDPAGLVDIALAELQRHQAEETINFRSKQSTQIVYGRDYVLGDKCILAIDDIVVNKRLLQVNGKIDVAGVSIDGSWGDLVL